MRNKGKRRRELGMARARAANDNEDPTWREDTLKKLEPVAWGHEYVSPDILRQYEVREPPHPNAWGSIWKEAIKRGWIEPAPELTTNSNRAETHASKMTVHRSLICRGPKHVTS